MLILRNKRQILSAFAAFLLIAVAVAVVLLVSRDALARGAFSRHEYALALGLVRDDVSLAMQLGNYYFGGGDYDLAYAQAAYEKAVAIDPSVLWGHYQIARILFVQGESNDALAEINLSLKYNASNLRALYVKGLIDEALHDLPAAEADFREFIPWGPTEWAGYNDLSWVLLEEGKYADAEMIIKGGMQKIPQGDKNPWLWNNMGVAALNLKDFQDAIFDFGKAQSFAADLTTSDWRASYPGNDPALDASGLDTFHKNIAINLEQAKLGQIISP